MILTVTLNPAVDHTVHLDEPLDAGTVQRTNDTRFDAGGKGINVSKYLDGFGAETTATGILGGFLGSFVESRLTSDGIPHDFVEIDGQTRLNTTVLTDEEYKINHAGPAVDASAIDAIIERIAAHDPETVVVAGSLPPGLAVDAIDRIAGAGDWATVVDIGGEGLTRLTGTYALCKPNRAELAAATGEPTTTVEDCLRAAETLQSDGFERIVASLGADGAVLVTRTKALHAPATDTDVVDTVGAGDALLAGMLAAFAGGSTDEKSLRTGVAVAARVVSVPGTTVPSLSTLDSAETPEISTY
jgi:1-phosphofructokinase